MGLPPSGVVATAASDPELTAMLARAAVSIGLEVNRPPSPEPSRLDDWFLGAGRGSQPRPAPVPFFPEVHEELTSSWMAPFTARSRSSASSVLTTLDGGVARGYAGIPQVERAVAVPEHLWLNLAEMKDVDKARFLDAPISQEGLFGDTVEGFAQQFSAVQQQTEAIQHILPRRDAPSTAAPRGQASVCPSPWAPSCVLQSRSAPGRIDT